MSSRISLAHNCALGDRDGTADFYVGNSDGSLLMSTIERRGGGERITVPMHLLSSYVKDRVDLLKVDVEGAEHGVLEDLGRDRIGGAFLSDRGARVWFRLAAVGT